MAYEMRVKGRPEPVMIEQGADVLIAKHEIYLQTKVDEAVVINGWHGRLSLINDFMQVRGSNATGESKSDEIHREYTAERERILKMSLDERASRMEFFRLVYQGFTGQKSETVKVGDRPIEDLAREIQKAFFAKHPKRVHCDPSEFRPLIKSNKCSSLVDNLIGSIMKQEYFAESHLK